MMKILPSRGPLEVLNEECRCFAVEAADLRAKLEADAATAGLYDSILVRQPHLFSASPVFISRDQIGRMQAVIEAVEWVVSRPPFQAAIAGRAPGSARFEPGPKGVFLGYDFHLGKAGPQLIEINTNAGGALLNLVLAKAQRACCTEVEGLVSGQVGLDVLEESLVEMFKQEWRLQRGERSLKSIAIVDDAPQGQYLYPEFLLFQRLFEKAGLKAVIADPAELQHRDGKLWFGELPIDLVYNRLTDFYLEEAANAELGRAYAEGDVVMTPHPAAHLRYADKRNLTLLSDAALLRSWGVPEEKIAVLVNGIPRTFTVDPAEADRLWSERKQYFFKPVAGYGSKAAYRGDKITRGVWEELLKKPYVAQIVVPPSERTVDIGGATVPLKMDVRNYAYGSTVQLLAARLYQGQTTNFRTVGGGFAPVFTEAAP